MGPRTGVMRTSVSFDGISSNSSSCIIGSHDDI